jgi:hypothetical protein
MKTWPGISGTLEPVDEKADGVVVFGMNLHQRAGLPGDRLHLQNLKVAQGQVRIGHKDLQRRVAIGHQCRQFLSQHIFRRICDDQMEGVVDMAVLSASA